MSRETSHAPLEQNNTNAIPFSGDISIELTMPRVFCRTPFFSAAEARVPRKRNKGASPSLVFPEHQSCFVASSLRIPCMFTHAPSRSNVQAGPFSHSCLFSHLTFQVRSTSGAFFLCILQPPPHIHMACRLVIVLRRARRRRSFLVSHPKIPPCTFSNVLYINDDWERGRKGGRGLL